MPGLRTTLILACVAMTLTACSPLSLRQGASGQSNHVAQSSSDAVSCRQMLKQVPDQSAASLDPAAIRLLNWNIQKGKQLGWQTDLSALTADSQLVLMQEAALDPEMISAERLASYWSFAPGYREDDTLTGVLTLSSIEPLTHCNLTAWEPWLRSPKATDITEYALTGTSKTLVVVNLHAVNFTLGVKPYRRQLDRIVTALRDHDGPLIVSGDFNSWRLGRERAVQSLVDELQLIALEYGDDQRVQIFGRPIDHIFVRGLQTVTASAVAVDSSDHNPISVMLSLLQDEPTCC